jgi:hypothetical protein
VFDPTIFDNMKVALEGAVYDLDFAGEILITSRSDRVELAAMSREYTIAFQDRKEETASESIALLTLSAGTADLAGEILDLSPKNGQVFGCTLQVRFSTKVERLEECREIEGRLAEIWSYRPRITQELTFLYEDFPADLPTVYRNTITLDFGRKINEDNIDDMFTLVDHTLYSLRQLR